MGTEPETPTQDDPGDPNQQASENEQQGFAADLRRMRQALTQLLSDRASDRRGLRSQGAVGLIGRADATLPPRRAIAGHDEEKDEEAIESKT